MRGPCHVPDPEMELRCPLPHDEAFDEVRDRRRRRRWARGTFALVSIPVTEDMDVNALAGLIVNAVRWDFLGFEPDLLLQTAERIVSKFRRTLPRGDIDLLLYFSGAGGAAQATRNAGLKAVTMDIKDSVLQDITSPHGLLFALSLSFRLALPPRLTLSRRGEVRCSGCRRRVRPG